MGQRTFRFLDSNSKSELNFGRQHNKTLTSRSVIEQRVFNAFLIKADNINEGDAAERLQNLAQEAAVASLVAKVPFRPREHLLTGVELSNRSRQHAHQR